MLKGCPDRRVLDRDQQIPSVRERGTQTATGKTTPYVQKHKRWSHAVAKHDSFCLVKKTTVSELEFCRSRIIRSDHWNFRRDGDKTPLERTGIRSDTREPCRQSICEGMGIQTRYGTDETCNADVVEKKQTTLDYVRGSCFVLFVLLRVCCGAWRHSQSPGLPTASRSLTALVYRGY